MTAVTARLVEGVSTIPADQWDACAGDANPFVGHAFLTALEASGSVGGGGGGGGRAGGGGGGGGRPPGVGMARTAALRGSRPLI